MQSGVNSHTVKYMAFIVQGRFTVSYGVYDIKEIHTAS